MATQSPFSWLADAAQNLRAQLPNNFPASLTPPPWMVSELQQRVVLFLNHVLASEREATQRLARQKGRRIELVWQELRLQLQPTPAGLLERAAFDGFDLRLTVTESSPLDVLSALARGDKPRVHIEGDVQLAAEINWLIDNVRWDAEEDLARLIGDAPAHTLAQLGRQTLQALRAFVARRAPVAAGSAP